MSLHPQFTQVGALVQKFLDSWHVSDPSRLGVPIRRPVEHARLFRLKRIDEKGRMGRDDELGVVGGQPALLGQLGQQPGMQVVFRFLDTHESGRFRIVEQGQVGQQLEGAVGGETGQDRR